ncbi:phage tail protein [Nocardioides sp.]|uniref:phage tail protein n=1 Tax=Nocardioides sp. TaxID=35761 RepID=UPI002C158290|nr:phage tail protein [Nocardioides sp.]HXH78135.1 phage tail protein [Nocardioides sp.]
MAIDTHPLTTFRFEVVLDLDEPTAGLESPLCEAAFAECDGLDLTMTHKTVESGGVNDRQQHLIGPIANGQLTLKRGMTHNTQLWTWFSHGTRPGSVLTAHGEITLWTAAGDAATQFTVLGALPVKMRAPSLNARDGLVAVEELTLVYEQLVVGPAGSNAGFSIGASVGFSAGVSVSASAGISGGVSAGAGFGVGASASAGISGGIGGGFG